MLVHQLGSDGEQILQVLPWAVGFKSELGTLFFLFSKRSEQVVLFC